jgi:hypothetical protein
MQRKELQLLKWFASHYLTSKSNTNLRIQKKAEAELAKTREAEKAARSYDLLFEVEEDPDAPKLTGKAIEEDFM